MGKTYSKAELIKKANKDIFENYPKAEKVFATSDGQFFLSENRARLHVSGTKLKVMEIENDKVSETSDTEDVNSKPKGADALIESAKDATLEEAEAALKEENNAKKPRKTVIAAFETRIEELKKAD